MLYSWVSLRALPQEMGGVDMNGTELKKPGFIGGPCSQNLALFCAAWDGTGAPGSGFNLKPADCQPKTCGYSRESFKSEPIVVKKKEN